ncbi:hypothetical protein BT67DRAFT_458718 [Trichocladium antarcticum]|uniref:Uncharacterized protein n=1 Tax=Trichocladium antarcticum TaxID=1450529 RepID=A0AAN6ZA32_9PEZI|nr:hypothetical protein BT67DRAFT_458718 [Trichocladium antarcticum]
MSITRGGNTPTLACWPKCPLIRFYNLFDKIRTRRNALRPTRPPRQRRCPTRTRTRKTSHKTRPVEQVPDKVPKLSPVNGKPGFLPLGMVRHEMPLIFPSRPSDQASPQPQPQSVDSLIVNNHRRGLHTRSLTTPSHPVYDGLRSSPPQNLALAHNLKPYTGVSSHPQLQHKPAEQPSTYHYPVLEEAHLAIRASAQLITHHPRNPPKNPGPPAANNNNNPPPPFSSRSFPLHPQQQQPAPAPGPKHYTRPQNTLLLARLPAHLPDGVPALGPADLLAHLLLLRPDLRHGLSQHAPGAAAAINAIDWAGVEETWPAAAGSAEREAVERWTGVE